MFVSWILFQVLESVQELGDQEASSCYVDDLLDDVETLSESDLDMDTISVRSTPKPKLRRVSICYGYYITNYSIKLIFSVNFDTVLLIIRTIIDVQMLAYEINRSWIKQNSSATLKLNCMTPDLDLQKGKTQNTAAIWWSCRLKCHMNRNSCFYCWI